MDTKSAEFAQKLGTRIVQLRKELNFAQERLATLAKMNKGYLSSVESGQRVPSVGMLMRLAKVLQVQLFDLFVFPDTGPWDRIWDELRRGDSAPAEQLRARHGLAGGKEGKGSKGGTKTARPARAAASAKRKSTGRAPKKAPEKAPAGRTAQKQTRGKAAPAKGTRRRSAR